RKGRGSISNPAGRFEARAVEAIEETLAEEALAAESDAGELDAFAGSAAPPGSSRRALASIAATPVLPPSDRPKTRVHHDATRTIVARNDSPDIPFERSINPYRGCEHGCIYCFARPGHAYLG